MRTILTILMDTQIFTNSAGINVGDAGFNQCVGGSECDVSQPGSSAG